VKIFAKLTGAFAIVALICAIVGALGWVGINSTENGLIEVAEVRLPAVAGLGQMLESMNAIKSAERTMMNPILSLADRQHELDNLKERWAEFEAGEDKFKGLPKTPAETALMENFLQLEKQWRGEHAKLVELVSQIKLDDVQRLESILVARQLDHIKWVAALDKTVAAQVPFSGQLDPTLCGLGKWMSGFTTSSEGFSQIMAGLADRRRPARRGPGDLQRRGETDPGGGGSGVWARPGRCAQGERGAEQRTGDRFRQRAQSLQCHHEGPGGDGGAEHQSHHGADPQR